MNTIEIGNELEAQVYEWLKENLDTYGKLVKLNRHKIYHCSNGRKIVVDVSIDVYLSQQFADQDKPSQTYIFECKNLNGKLNVSDFDEWRGKLHDLGETGHKLFIVTRKGFANPTIKYAKGEHVGLIKFPNSLEIEYILQRAIANFSSKEQSIICLNGDGYDDEIICFYDYAFISLSDLLEKLHLPIKDKYRFEAPHYTNKYIEKIAEDIIKTHIGYVDILASLLEDKTFPIVSSKKMPDDRLGYLDIPTNNIYISAALSPEDVRYRFVLAHEYGHFLLHREMLDNKIARLYENEDTLKSLFISSKELQAIERQANTFASYLLMPKNEFIKAAAFLFNYYDIRGGFMYVDKQPCNLKDYHNVTSRLAQKFRVSKQATAYRMETLGLLRVNAVDRSIIGI